MAGRQLSGMATLDLTTKPCGDRRRNGRSGGGRSSSPDYPGHGGVDIEISSGRIPGGGLRASLVERGTKSGLTARQNGSPSLLGMTPPLGAESFIILAICAMSRPQPPPRPTMPSLPHGRPIRRLPRQRRPLRGPATPEGKARSALNGTRHGLAGPFRLLPGEDAAAYGRLRAALLARHAPADAAEEHWVEELAFAAWRLRRLRALDAAALDAADGTSEPEGGRPPACPPSPRSPATAAGSSATSARPSRRSRPCAPPARACPRRSRAPPRPSSAGSPTAPSARLNPSTPPRQSPSAPRRPPPPRPSTASSAAASPRWSASGPADTSR